MRHNKYFIEGVLNSNERVISEIYNDYFPGVLKFIMQNKGTKEDAEDVFQAAMLQISARIRKRDLAITHTFGGYIFGACKNLWRRQLKKERNRVTISENPELISDPANLADALLEQEQWDLFEEKLEMLSDNCKKLIALFFKKVPYQEIMDRFSYSSQVVARQGVFKCKKRLIELIRKDKRYKRMKQRM